MGTTPTKDGTWVCGKCNIVVSTGGQILPGGAKVYCEKGHVAQKCPRNRLQSFVGLLSAAALGTLFVEYGVLYQYVFVPIFGRPRTTVWPCGVSLVLACLIAGLFLRDAVKLFRNGYPSTLIAWNYVAVAAGVLMFPLMWLLQIYVDAARARGF